MKLEVRIVDKENWSRMSENAHLAAFDKIKPVEMERIDFAILIVDSDEDRVISYATAREFDSETLYLAYGGVFRDARETSLSMKAYHLGIEWVKNHYKRITTLIENENVVMLKMAMKEDLRVRGTRYYAGLILVEMGWEHE